jgi:hypothetical protein
MVRCATGFCLREKRRLTALLAGRCRFSCTRLFIVVTLCGAACPSHAQSAASTSAPEPAIPAQGQATSVPLSPTEAYKDALAPFTAAKAQPGDLTDADKLALELGEAKAALSCTSLTANASAIAADEKELIALSQVCIFGRQYEPARATLVKYLALPEAPQRKLALVLLIRALLGLGEPDSAYLQVISLLRDYPYDAQIHFAIDQVIDAMEDSSGNPVNALQVMQLCDQQNTAALPLLASGKALEGKEISASASVLFSDAMRCTALAKAWTVSPPPDMIFRDAHGNVEGRLSEELRKVLAQNDKMLQLNTIAQKPDWAGTAEFAPMQAALWRQQMVGFPVPLSSLHGQVVSNNALVSRVVPLTRGTVLLFAFALWSPSAADLASSLARLAPQQQVYAITSWSANTGTDEAPPKLIVMAMRMWQQTAPAHVTVLVVPDKELERFHADTFPAGILIRDGVVRSNGVLSTRGAEKELVRMLPDHVKSH